jgi:hypothetical protein
VPQIMERPECASDCGRYAALGAMVVAVSALATVNGAVVAYFFILCEHWLAAGLAGLGWGGLVLSLDRLLLTTFVKRKGASEAAMFLAAAPRLAVAVLMALLIGAQAELVIFRHRLDVQTALDRQAEMLDQKARLDRRYASLDALEAQQTGVQARLVAARREASEAWLAASCEADGRCGSGSRGFGPLYAEKQARFAELRADASREEAEARPQLQTLAAQIEVLRTRKSAELDAFGRVAEGGDDIMDRLIALRHLEADPVHGSTVTAAKWLIRLLSLAIELLPILTKLTVRGPYEAALEAEREIRCARADAWREAAMTSARVSVDQSRLMDQAVLDASSGLAHQTLAECLTGEAAATARAELTAEVLDRAMAMARRTAARIWDDPLAEAEVVATGRSARRRAEANVASTQARASSVMGALRRVVADAARRFGHGKTADIRSPSPVGAE